MHKNRIFYRLMVVALVAGVFAIQTVVAVAQSSSDEWKNAIVFSMISTDEGAPLIKQALAAMNHPDLLDDFEQAQREAFATLDFSKPKCFVYQTNGRSFRFLAFAAMKDVTELPYGIGELFADLEPNRDGWYKMPLPNANQLPIVYQNVFVKQQGDWAYVCYGVTSPPKELPSDPTVLLEDLPQEYPVALRLNFAALPKSMVNGYAALGKMSLSILKTFLPMAQMGGEFEAQLALASFDFFTVFAKETIDQLAKFVNETESLTIGLNGNADNDLTITSRLIAKPGTDTAKAVESIGTCTTDLIGFYRPNEAFYTEIYAYPIQEYEKPFYKNILTAADKWLGQVFDVARNDNEEIEKVMAIAKKFPGVVQQTTDTGKIDCADFFATDMTFYAAMKIAGGNALIEPINDLCDFGLMKLAELKVDFGIDSGNTSILERETYIETHLWKVAVPVSLFFLEESILEEIQNDPERSLPGHVTYIFGLRDDLFVFAYGFSPTIADTLKKAVDESGKPTPMPREIAVFSADRIGQTIKTFGFDIIFRDRDEFKIIMDIIDNIPDNAKIVIAQDVEANVLTWTWVFDGKLWPTVGAILDKIIEQSGGVLPW